MSDVPPQVFIDHANPIMKKGKGVSTSVVLRRFKAFFGVTPLVCTVAWKKLGVNLPSKASPKHLLWSYYF